MEKKSSPKGYSELKGIEQYHNASIRNVKIIRVDLLAHLSDHFTDKTISENRSVLYYILAGYGSKDNSKLILESLEYLYTIDDVFKVKFGKLVYFRDTHLESLSVYDALLEDTRKSLGDVWDKVVASLNYVKLLGDSQLYLYFSVNQDVSNESLLQIKGLEVVSR